MSRSLLVAVLLSVSPAWAGIMVMTPASKILEGVKLAESAVTTSDGKTVTLKPYAVGLRNRGFLGKCLRRPNFFDCKPPHPTTHHPRGLGYLVQTTRRRHLHELSPGRECGQNERCFRGGADCERDRFPRGKHEATL